jgi:hypothetical protein
VSPIPSPCSLNQEKYVSQIAGARRSVCFSGLPGVWFMEQFFEKTFRKTVKNAEHL